MKTGFSFKMAAGHLPEVISRIKEIGYRHAPIADHQSTFGFRRWRDLCKKEGLTPVYGVELPVSPNPKAERNYVADHWQFYAKNDLRDLYDLIQKATSNVHGALSYREACEAQGVFKITGAFVQLNEMFIGRDLYIGLTPAMPNAVFRDAHKLGHQFMMAQCNLYPRREDLEFYRLCCKNPERQTYPLHILSDDELLHEIEKFEPGIVAEQALINRDFMFHACKAQMAERGDFIRPEIECSLTMKCIAGAQARGIDLATEPLYNERLKHELSVIQEKGFEDYFHIVADMMQFARANMLCGPARGSSCGSLVCYLLGITTIDPLKHGLMFERFIDANRNDLPDIDSDLSDARRELVFDYMREKYGEDHVARLGSVGYYGPKSILRQASIPLGYWPSDYESLVSGMIEHYEGDEGANTQLRETLESTETGRAFAKRFPGVMVATRMEAHPANASRHAAGLLLTDRPIRDYVAVDGRGKTAMLDKRDAEVFNLLKIDVLGLKQLSVFERTLELAGKNPIGFLDTIPMDDDAAFKVLRDHHYAGVFQFNGSAVQALAKRVPIDCIDDLADISALARPGANTAAETWIARRVDREPVMTCHPMLTSITEDVYGVICYQEQVMSIVRKIGGLSWGDANKIRKIISKTVGHEAFAQFGKPFIEGAMRFMDERTAQQIWDQICAMGAYAFNKSHSYAYAYMSYYCAWFKAHYPLEFIAATLDNEKDSNKQLVLLRELAEEGVSYIPFDKDRSIERWTVIDGTLIGPITNLIGIGPVMQKQVLEARNNPEVELDIAIQRRMAQAKTSIDTLFPIEAKLKEICPDGLEALNILSKPVKAIDLINGTYELSNDGVLFVGLADSIEIKDLNDAASIKRRGGKRLTGDTLTLNIWLRDDTGKMFCKIGWKKYRQYAPAILEKGGAGHVFYALKGRVKEPYNDGFKMFDVEMVRYIGTTKPTKKDVQVSVENPFEKLNNKNAEAIWNGLDEIANAEGWKMPRKLPAIIQVVVQAVGAVGVGKETVLQWGRNGKMNEDSTTNDIRRLREDKLLADKQKE